MATSTAARVLSFACGATLLLGVVAAGLGWYAWNAIGNSHFNINGNQEDFDNLRKRRMLERSDPERRHAYASAWASRMQSCLPASFRGLPRSDVQGRDAFIDKYRSSRGQELRWTYGQGVDQMQVLVQVNLDSELSEGAILPFSAEVLDSMKPAHGFLWTDGNLGFQAVLTYGYSAPDMDPPLTQAERKDRPYTRFMRLCPSRTYDDVFVPPANIALFLKASDESTIRDFLKTLDPVRIAELE